MRIRAILAIVFLLFVFFGSGILVNIYTNWLWFSEVGYLKIYTTFLMTKIWATLGFMAVFFIIVWGNIKIASRTAPKNMEWYDEKTVFLKDTKFSMKQLEKILLVVTLFLSFITGTAAISKVNDILYFLNPSSFGINDPIFHKDIGFYIFKLPIMEFIVGWLFTTLVFSLIGIMVIYISSQAISLLQGKFSMDPNIVRHLSVIFAGFALLKGIQYWFSMYNLLYSSRGVAFGASYTDVHAQLFAYKILLVISILAAIAFIVNIQFKQIKIPLATIGVWLVTAFLLGEVYPGIIQRFAVTPNEIAKEKPYIENNIKFTNKAYGLDKIKEIDFPVRQNLTRDIVNRDAATIHNVRLWDYRPLKDTYRQIQVIRQYYDFLDVDIDRYHIGNEYVQLMLSAREISVPTAARTWINEHLVYTHGYGLAATRVNAVAPEGLPILLIKDIPPVSPPDLKIDRPEIYFGESQKGYILVKTNQKEFDYPKGNDNVYTTYKGTAGIPLNGFRRLIFSYLFGDTDLFFTSTITPDSRIVYRRDILQRVKTIAPFLSYDSDPYIVISGGKLYWILDGYTHTMRYPYSQPYGHRFNYIRNSVKVVLDAYNGTVRFYVINPDDPIIQTWQKIFPGVFQPFEKMPEDLQAHVRYPEDLFTIQADMYSVYHMRDPQTFYNQEDKWTIPNEVFESDKQPVEPYYVIMRLPEEAKEQFLMMVPFAPATKNNMIAWMAAKSDTPEYGDLIVYKFPKDKLIYGPMQIEARIDQDPGISSQLSLWNQKGSKVIRGNLLVIPIDDSILYVEPLYLKSEQSQIPELKRVIVAYNERIAMESTLEDGLNAVFGGKSTPSGEQQVSEQPVKAAPVTRNLRELAKEASQHFDKAQERLRAGDWSGYGAEMQKMRDILQQMEK